MQRHDDHELMSQHAQVVQAATLEEHDRRPLRLGSDKPVHDDWSRGDEEEWSYDLFDLQDCGLVAA